MRWLGIPAEATHAKKTCASRTIFARSKQGLIIGNREMGQLNKRPVVNDKEEGIEFFPAFPRIEQAVKTDVLNRVRVYHMGNGYGNR
jgi:hypothetical protein